MLNPCVYECAWTLLKNKGDIGCMKWKSILTNYYLDSTFESKKLDNHEHVWYAINLIFDGNHLTSKTLRTCFKLQMSLGQCGIMLKMIFFGLKSIVCVQHPFVETWWCINWSFRHCSFWNHKSGKLHTTRSH